LKYENSNNQTNDKERNSTWLSVPEQTREDELQEHEMESRQERQEDERHEVTHEMESH
jgi:hypothetical protein